MKDDNGSGTLGAFEALMKEIPNMDHRDDGCDGRFQECRHCRYHLPYSKRQTGGRMGETEYVIFEQPRTVLPCEEATCTEKPYTAVPDTEEPCTENPAGINKDITSTEETNTEMNKERENKRRMVCCIARSAIPLSSAGA